MQYRSTSERARGFTLSETLIVIALMGVVGIALNSVIRSFYISNAYLLEQTAALDNARRGLTEMEAGLREASYGEDGAYPIASAATSSITFFADLDSDTAVEKVQYFLNGKTLYRTVTNAAGSPPVYPTSSGTTTLALYTQNATSTPLFSYYDADGGLLSATSTDVSKIASIVISLYVDLNPTRAPNVFTLTETVKLRNIHD